MTPAPETPPRATRLYAPRAWLGGRWADGVVFEVDATGHWSRIDIGQPPPPGAQALRGPVLPGLVNAHGHAFQRAFAGQAERRDAEHDDFWSWRDRMYAVAQRITPAALRDIAAWLFHELLAGGYTQVCEFHYLHRAEGDGALAMALALRDAALEAGIGITLLPVVYERAGFAQPALRPDQRRFAASADDVLAWQRALRNAGVACGAALHSLRAVRPESLRALAEASDGPLHIHAAEQTAEVNDCLAATGLRPIEWLARHAGLNARWQLVHATHALPAEIDAVAASGAGVVLCPGTEANLGDGLPDLPRWLSGSTPLAIGSDSHVLRGWPEELRWLEYGQRLTLQRRNVAALPPAQPATAARLFDRVLGGGGAAAGFARWGFEPGARADLLVIDTRDPALVGIAPERLLDALVFAAPARPFSAVMCGGRWTMPPSPALAARFEAAMQFLAG